MGVNASIAQREIPDVPEDFSEFHPVLARVMASRGMTSMDDLDMSLGGILPPDNLPDIDKAVEIIGEAVKKDSLILIAGDYDADGATATSIALEGLESFGCTNVHFTIPDRQRHGYGLSPILIDDWVEEHGQVPDLVMTVDNGVSAHAGIERAKTLGAQVVVTDHHLPGETLPDADAMVNPNIDGAIFESKAIAGCGVAFYVIAAVRKSLDDQGWFKAQGREKPALSPLLDLVALGTIADVVALDSNNRRLVQSGLERIRSEKCRPGIKAIFEVAGRDRENAKSSDLGFTTGPRLNAAGRISHMKLGVECLLERKLNAAIDKAKVLEQTNAERKEIEQQMIAQAGGPDAVVGEIGDRPDCPTRWVVYNPENHQGVIGIVAGRLKEQWVRPVIVFAPNDPEDPDSPDSVMKGSGRSPDGIHLRDVLADIAAQHPDLLLGFGGHAAAAGLSIRFKDLEAFREAFKTAVLRRQDAFVEQLEVLTDGELEPGHFSMRLARDIESKFPWGTAFPEPVFDNTFEVVSRRELSDGKHWRLGVRPIDESGQRGKEVNAIWFNIGTDVPTGRYLRLAFSLNLNRYRGRETLQLMAKAGHDVELKVQNAPMQAGKSQARLESVEKGSGKSGTSPTGRSKKSGSQKGGASSTQAQQSVVVLDENDDLGRALAIATEKKASMKGRAGIQA